MIILLSPTIILVITGAFIYFQDSAHEGITAMDAKNITYNSAKIWHPNAVVVHMRSGYLYSSGRAPYWFVAYAKPTIIGASTEFVEYKVDAEGTITGVWHSSGKYRGQSLETNWTIDSDEAYEIAISNYKIKKFLRKYDDAFVSSATLGGTSNRSVWVISWRSWGIFDNPHSARIEIDASTGEVLHVDAYMGDFDDAYDWWDLNLTVIIIFGVFLGVMLWRAVSFRKFIPATFFAYFISFMWMSFIEFVFLLSLLFIASINYYLWKGWAKSKDVRLILALSVVFINIGIVITAPWDYCTRYDVMSLLNLVTTATILILSVIIGRKRKKIGKKEG